MAVNASLIINLPKECVCSIGMLPNFEKFRSIRSQHRTRSAEVFEFAAACGNNDFVLRCGAMRNKRFTVFQKADTDSDMVSVASGVFVDERKIACPNIAFFNFSGFIPLTPCADADFSIVSVCPRPIEYNTKAQIRSSPVRKGWLFRLWNGRGL